MSQSQHILKPPQAHQNNMHKSLVQRGCEVAKAVNAFAVAQGFGQGGPEGERCGQAQACSRKKSGRAGGMLALLGSPRASPCMCITVPVQGLCVHPSLTFGTVHNASKWCPTASQPG